MSNNGFGFRDLGWVRYLINERVKEMLEPVRIREKELVKEILNLQGQIDVRNAEIKNLHLKAILDARFYGVNKGDIDSAARMADLQVSKTIKGFPVITEKDSRIFNETNSEKKTFSARNIQEIFATKKSDSR